jgi:hypothetical protein
MTPGRAGHGVRYKTIRNFKNEREKSVTGNVKEISLGDDFGTAVVQGGGVTVELSDNGDVTVHTRGDVKLRPAANDGAGPATLTALKPGDKMPDGTIYAGSLDGRDIFTTSENEWTPRTFGQALEDAADLNKRKANGHNDWRVPPLRQLYVLFDNCAAIGGFCERDQASSSWYWSSEEGLSKCNAEALRFSDGWQLNREKKSYASLRCVRG